MCRRSYNDIHFERKEKKIDDENIVFELANFVYAYFDQQLWNTSDS